MLRLESIGNPHHKRLRIDAPLGTFLMLKFMFSLLHSQYENPFMGCPYAFPSLLLGEICEGDKPKLSVAKSALNFLLILAYSRKLVNSDLSCLFWISLLDTSSFCALLIARVYFRSCLGPLKVI